MSKLQTYNQSDKKHSIISDETLVNIQSKLLPLLNNADYLGRLKKLITKYESLNPDDIGLYLYKIKKFKPVTQHKIREFINRVAKSQHINNSEQSFPFQSDESRESFSSKSEADSGSYLQREVFRLWRYPICQKEICELLYDNGDLEVCSLRTVAIDFDRLSAKSHNSLNNYILIKSPLIDEIQKDGELSRLFQILTTEKFDEKTTKNVYDILLGCERIVANSAGRRSISMTALKPETKKRLLDLLQPQSITPKSVSSSGRGSTNSSTVVTPTTNKSSWNSVATTKIVTSSSEQYGVFDKEKHHYLFKKISEAIDHGLKPDILKIIHTHEDIDINKDPMLTLNVKKLRDVTKYHLIKYFTDNPFATDYNDGKEG